MPRDPSKLSKADLVAELRERHGVEHVVVDREPTDDDPSTVERVEPDKLTKDELLERYAGVLDTTTEDERVAAAAEQVERENEQAKAAADAAEDFAWGDTVPGAGMARLVTTLPEYHEGQAELLRNYHAAVASGADADKIAKAKRAYRDGVRALVDELRPSAPSE